MPDREKSEVNAHRQEGSGIPGGQKDGTGKLGGGGGAEKAVGACGNLQAVVRASAFG